MEGLNGATLGVLVIDYDRSSCVELLLHLEDLRGQRDFLDAIVGPFAGHERLDEPAQGVRTQQAVGNDHGSMTSALRDEGRASVSMLLAFRPKYSKERGRQEGYCRGACCLSPYGGSGSKEKFPLPQPATRPG